MLKLKKSTVFALKEFIQLFSGNATASRKQAMLEEAVKNFELIANGKAGHSCCVTVAIKPDRSGFEFHYAYEFPINTPHNWVAISPERDLEEIDA